MASSAGIHNKSRALRLEIALRILEKESRLESIALTDVQRQKPRAYREAIQALRRDPEHGFEILDAIGAVEEIQPMDRAAHIAKAYADSIESNVLVVSPRMRKSAG